MPAGMGSHPSCGASAEARFTKGASLMAIREDASVLGAGGDGLVVAPRRWKALFVLALVQFMIIIDITVVNVALPSIQRSLHFTGDSLAWVVDGYALMAGGLLLFGGRVGDLFGRKRLFLIGTVVFAVASFTSGAAQNHTMLIFSRFAQSRRDALASPAALP